MPVSLPLVGAARHPRLPEKSGAPIKAHLRKAENWSITAEIVRETFKLTRLSLKEFARELGVDDERQVARWMAEEPTERPQLEVVIAAFRSVTQLAMAHTTPEDERASVTVETTIRIRRHA